MSKVVGNWMEKSQKQLADTETIWDARMETIRLIALKSDGRPVTWSDSGRGSEKQRGRDGFNST